MNSQDNSGKGTFPLKPQQNNSLQRQEHLSNEAANLVAAGKMMEEAGKKARAARKLKQKELGGWMSMAHDHWKQHRPKMYRELLKAGRLPKALEEAAQRTAKEMDALMDAGLTYHQAWESVMQTYLLLPEEKSQKEKKSKAYDLMGEILDLHRKIGQPQD